MTEISFTVPVMRATAMRTMPSAIRSGDRSSFSPSASTARSAASVSIAISPPSARSGRNRPSNTLASVTVGAVPPRP